jgi:hypothetical protein
MKKFTLLFVLICQSLYAGTPTEAMTAFLKGAKAQNFEETWKHSAQFEGIEEDFKQYLQSRVQKILDLSAKGWHLELLEEKISGDCAVIVLNEINVGDTNKSFDIDPAFLIKQKGEWKVIPSLTKWDLLDRIPVDKQPSSVKLDEVKVAAYKGLEKWFEERSKAIRDERRAKAKAERTK